MKNFAGLKNFLDRSNYNWLKNIKNRKKFADTLCNFFDYPDHSVMLQFIEEMRGLNFHRNEDRALFCEFLFCWLKEDINESFNA